MFSLHVVVSFQLVEVDLGSAATKGSSSHLVARYGPTQTKPRPGLLKTELLRKDLPQTELMEWCGSCFQPRRWGATGWALRSLFKLAPSLSRVFNCFDSVTGPSQVMQVLISTVDAGSFSSYNQTTNGAT